MKSATPVGENGKTYESLSSGGDKISDIGEKESHAEDLGYKSDNVAYSNNLKHIKNKQIDLNQIGFLEIESENQKKL